MRSHQEWLEIIAGNVRRLLKLHDMTNDGLASKSGLSPTTVSMIRNTRLKNLGLETLVKLAKSFNVELMELFKPITDSRFSFRASQQPYLTFSQWFWETFYRDVVPFDGGLTDEAKRRMFESFLHASRPDHNFSPAEIESIWNDRLAFLPKKGQEVS